MIFQGTLSDQDVKTHLEFTFHVPEAIQGLELVFEFAPATVRGFRNMICLSPFDPGGFRGSGHRHGARPHVQLGAAYVTPGYLPGTLPAGRWRVVAHTHMVMPGELLTYRLTVSATGAPAAQPHPQASTSQVAQGQPLDGVLPGCSGLR